MTQAASTPAVVLVEDEPDILIILHRLLRDFTSGCDIIPVPDGETALAEVDRRHVPLVITDYNMPRMNGLELATRLKQRTPPVRVAMLTAYDSPELRRQVAACGIDYYLPKPFPLERFERIMRESLA
jgi:CheY-like chemotaxis protein